MIGILNDKKLSLYYVPFQINVIFPSDFSKALFLLHFKIQISSNIKMIQGIEKTCIQIKVILFT
jgi:hypothetical protein